MSFRLPSRFWSALVALGIGGLVAGCAQAADRPPARNLEFSETNRAAMVTNPSELGGKKDGLGRLEEELNRSFEDFSLKNSLEGARARRARTLPPPVIQNKQVQQLLDRRKDWIFMTPEEMMAIPKAEDLLKPSEYGPDGQEKKKVSPMERFYEGLNRQGAGGLNAGAAGGPDPLGPPKETDPLDSLVPRDGEERLPSGVKNSYQKLRGMLGTGSSASVLTPALTHGTLSDIFGLGGDNNPSPDQIRAHEDYMKRYQELLGGTAPASSTDPLNPLGGTAPSPAAGGLPAPSVPSHLSSFDPQFAKPGPTHIPTPPADITAKVLNQWNPFQTQTAPIPETPKAPQPIPAIVDFPRRPF
jgi:hypothetical protein